MLRLEKIYSVEDCDCVDPFVCESVCVEEDSRLVVRNFIKIFRRKSGLPKNF